MFLGFFLTILPKHLSVEISDAHLISLFEHFVNMSKLCYNAVSSASDQHGSAWQSRGWICALSQVECHILNLCVSLWVKSSFPVLASTPTGKLHRTHMRRFQYCCHEGVIMKEIPNPQGKIMLSIPQNLHLVLLSLLPLLSQFFRLCICSLCLWLKPVFEKPPFRGTLLCLWVLCVRASLCACIPSSQFEFLLWQTDL